MAPAAAWARFPRWAAKIDRHAKRFGVARTLLYLLPRRFLAVGSRDNPKTITADSANLRLPNDCWHNIFLKSEMCFRPAATHSFKLGSPSRNGPQHVRVVVVSEGVGLSRFCQRTSRRFAGLAMFSWSAAFLLLSRLALIDWTRRTTRILHRDEHASCSINGIHDIVPPEFPGATSGL